MLAWTRPEHDGGAKIEGYIIEFQKSGSEEWICIADNVPLTEHQLQGLKEKQEYSFRVKAVNKAGESEPSEPSDPVVCKERLCKFPKKKNPNFQESFPKRQLSLFMFPASNTQESQICH